MEKSLTKMGLQKIDFFHIWAIKTMEDYAAYMKKGGIYEGILKAKEEGLVDHICFSTHLNGDDIAKVAQEGVFEGVTLGYNAVNFAYRRKGVEACAKAGMGITTMNRWVEELSHSIRTAFLLFVKIQRNPLLFLP